MKKLILIIAAAALAASCTDKQPQTEREAMNSLVKETIEASLACLERSVAEIGDTLKYPTYGTPERNWQVKSSADWVSGFYPGSLWYAYAISGNKDFENWAKSWTTGIEAEKYNTKTHDLGFRFMCTFGNGIKFDGENLEAAYKPIVLTAAQTLSGRYHPEFGALSSNWDRQAIEGTTPCVIDIMMNLELLFWAAENSGDPNYAQLAINHANTTWKDFLREDDGTYHIVRYSQKDGSVVDKGQLQGDVKESTWSRGHAWLVYGLVMSYRFTHDVVFLDRAKRAADYFIRNLNPDGIANWDFQSTENYTDVSASAIVTSALYEMITMLPDGREKDYYSCQADRMLSALCQEPYFIGRTTPCLLDHSVQYFHLDHNVDRPCSFADYYFMEALYRYSQLYLNN